MKSNLDKFFAADTSLEKDGVEFQVAEGVILTVRRWGGANNHRVKAAMAKHYKPVSRQVQNGTLPKEQEDAILIKAFVEACMVSWEGVEIDGVLTPYSPDAAIKLFTSLTELFEAVFSFAGDFNTYKADLGNS